MNLLMPNVSVAQKTPVNSAITLPKFTIRTMAIRKNVTRKPNSSRIRSESPLPVTAPIREHISREIYNAIVMGINDHSTVFPYFAPACAYV